MSESKTMAQIPSYDPQGSESISEIPERFLLTDFLSLTALGQWMFRGEPVEHPGVCAFFAKQLRRTEEGQYWVVNGPQRAFVTLEGAPFFITRLTVDVQEHTIQAQLNDGSEEPLDLASLTRDHQEWVYADVKRGQAGVAPYEAHRALITRTAIMELESLLTVTPDDRIALDWNGTLWPIPQLDTV